jgi:hypothetical protein
MSLNGGLNMRAVNQSAQSGVVSGTNIFFFRIFSARNLIGVFWWRMMTKIPLAQ